MSRSQKFFICKHCGNLIGLLHDAGVPMMCCGEKMVELTSGVEGATEKHTPVVKVEGCIVRVAIGEIPHPMEEAHSIQWIYLETGKGGQRVSLNPGEKPEAIFSVLNDEPVAAFAYCNLHGLWKTDIQK